MPLMSNLISPRSRFFPGNRGHGVQWTLLIFLSVLLIMPLELLHLPAALLLGPMMAAIVIAALGEASIRVPPVLFILAQGVIGVMIARGCPLPFSAK